MDGLDDRFGFYVGLKRNRSQEFVVIGSKSAGNARSEVAFVAQSFFGLFNDVLELGLRKLLTYRQENQGGELTIQQVRGLQGKGAEEIVGDDVKSKPGAGTGSSGVHLHGSI